LQAEDIFAFINTKLQYIFCSNLQYTPQVSFAYEENLSGNLMKL